MRGLRTWGCALALAAPVAAGAALPEADELEAAVQALAPVAAAQGLRLQSGALWHEALRLRTPLVAAYADDGRCLIGYSRYTPGRDYGWLFPDGPPTSRARWLRGAVAHELAHCVQQARARQRTGDSPRTPALAGTPAAPYDDEALADLAFAWQLDGDAAATATLMGLRAARQAQDPAHDSSAVVRCWLDQRTVIAAGDPRWFDQLLAVLRSCRRPPVAAAPDR